MLKMRERHQEEMINLFKFTCFVILICRGTYEQKAESFIELIQFTNFSIYNRTTSHKLSSVTRDDTRLKDIIWHIIYFSEFLPRIWYCRKEFVSNGFANNIKNKSKIAQTVDDYN